MATHTLLTKRVEVSGLAISIVMGREYRRLASPVLFLK